MYCEIAKNCNYHVRGPFVHGLVQPSVTKVEVTVVVEVEVNGRGTE